MSMEQYLRNWKLLRNESNPSSGRGFECNICLDIVKDPVVTFCGHLYCWHCIYRWISSFQENDDPAVEYLGQDQNPQCPVCKREVSEMTLIPLYGRGGQNNSELSHLIPRRPPSPGCRVNNNVFLPNSLVHRNNFVQPYYGSYIGGGWSTHLADPMIGVFGEIVFSRIFGNSETSLYGYPNSYDSASSNSPRLRRHMMQADESLSRVCFFLCCCVILCLLLF